MSGILYQEKGYLVFKGGLFSSEPRVAWITCYNDHVEIKGKLSLRSARLIGIAAKAIARAAGKGEIFWSIPYSKIRSLKFKKKLLSKHIEFEFYDDEKGKWIKVWLQKFPRIEELYEILRSRV